MTMNSFEERVAQALNVERATADMDDRDLQFYVGPHDINNKDFKIYRVISITLRDETTLTHGATVVIDLEHPG